MVGLAFDHAAQDQDLALGQLASPGIAVFSRKGHDPTQGMRQGNDVGSTYRSGIYTYSPEQEASAHASKLAYQGALVAKGYGAITTEILPAPVFYYAEDYHQQYLAKNPTGYCGIGGTGVSCPIGLAVT